jgi:hypothetical protein
VEESKLGKERRSTSSAKIMAWTQTSNGILLSVSRVFLSPLANVNDHLLLRLTSGSFES